MNFKDKLKQELTEEEQSNLKTAFDMVGDIAILEIDDELRHKETFIAETLLSCQKNIHTVLRKDSAHEGEFRTQNFKFLAGEDKRETIHIENKTRLKLNVETVYFSPRMSTERMRITELIKPDEKILVLFCGCAPYPCTIGKNTEAGEIVGVEINPEGHKYGLENIKLNKLENVRLYNGDARVVVDSELQDEKFDRILMPLPRGGEDFLDVALSVAKKGSVIHFYDFLHEDDFPMAEEKVAKACKAMGLNYKIIGLFKCGQYSPRTFRICLDFQVN